MVIFLTVLLSAVLSVIIYILSINSDAYLRLVLFFIFNSIFIYILLKKIFNIKKKNIDIKILNESITKENVELLKKNEEQLNKNKSFEKRLKVLENLSDFGESVLINPESKNIINTASSQIVNYLQPDILIIYIYNSKNNVLIPEKIYPFIDEETAELSVDENSEFCAVQSFLKVKIKKLRSVDSQALKPSASSKTYKNIICIPLFIEKDKLGVIEIGSDRVLDHFDINALMNFGQYLSMSIRISELMFKLKNENEQNERELLLAQELQQSIMPDKHIDRGNINIEFYHKPLREIGGDFYDIIEIDNEHLLIIFGDVSGKGIPAALIVSMIKTYFSNVSYINFNNPGKVLTEFNKFLNEKIDILHNFVAIFLGIININDAKIKFSFSGLEPPVIINKDYDIIKKFETDKPCVGMTADVDYDNIEIEMKKDNELLLYTDGLSDIYYEESAIQTVLKNIKNISGQTKDRISEIISKASNIHDDITFATLSIKK